MQCYAMMVIDSGSYYSFDPESRGKIERLRSFKGRNASNTTVYGLVSDSEDRSINIEAINK